MKPNFTPSAPLNRAILDSDPTRLILRAAPDASEPMFHDIETGEDLTLGQLRAEYERLKQEQPEEITYSFDWYVDLCLTCHNGTLERIRR